MALPLMPSTELFQPKPEPGWADNIVPGCQCAMCVGAQPRGNMATFAIGPTSTPNIPRAERPRDVPRGEVRSFQRGVYDNSNNASGQAFHGTVRWRIPGTLQVCDETGRSQWTYDEELPDGSLVCTRGGNRGSRWVPDAAPVPVGAYVVENGLVRGRYTLDEGANGVGLSGCTRWLDTTTRRLYGTADPSSRSLNSGLSELPDGTRRTVSGLVWEAT